MTGGVRRRPRARAVVTASWSPGVGVIPMGWRTFPAKRLNLGAPATSERLEESDEHQGDGHSVTSRTSAPASTPKVEHFTLDERAARGKAARAEVPRRVHGEWEPSPHRPDPVDLLEEQAQTRVPELVPIRYGRMLVSPFTFYRGAAALMASDLAGSPRTGLHAQLCGDAHLSNFGVLRGAGPPDGLRRQRPRRVAAGPVRMGRQAARRELRRRRPRPRVLRQGARRRQRRRRPVLPGGDARVRGDAATSTSGTRASTSRSSSPSSARR